MNRDSLSEEAARRLIEFLHATDFQYVVHLPYDRREPYYRPAEYGGFLVKTPDSTTDEGTKQHISDEDLMQTLQQALAVTVLPANETPTTVWGTIPEDESQIR